MHKYVVLVVMLMLVMLSAGLVQAQNPPQLDTALQDLSNRVGRTVTLTEVSRWSFEQQNFPDASLGCPQPDTLYAQVITPGIRFVINFGGQAYDYRVSLDNSAVILCATAPAEDSGPLCPPPDDDRFIPTRLQTGSQARVTDDGFPNNVRQLPGTSGQFVGEIPPGGVFTIIDGPECSQLDALIWWQVDFNGLLGWTAEGKVTDQGEIDYWLELLELPDVSQGGPPITLANVNSVVELELLQQSDRGFHLKWSPDGELIAVAGDFGVWIYNAQSPDAPPRRLLADVTMDVAFNTFGNLLMTLDELGNVAVWDVASGTQVRVLRSVILPEVPDDEPGPPTPFTNTLAWSPDEQLFAFGDLGGASVFDALTGALRFTLVGHTGLVGDVDFNADGSLLATVSVDGSVRLWDMQTGEVLLVVQTDGSLRSIDFSPDQQRIVAAGGNSNYMLGVWEVASGAEVWSAPRNETEFLIAVAFSRDGSLIFAGETDGPIRVWDAATGVELSTLRGHGRQLTDIAFNPAGTILASVSMSVGESPSSTALRLWGVPSEG